MGMLLINLEVITSITSSELFPVWQASRRLFAESILIKSNFPLVPVTSTGFAGLRASAAETSRAIIRRDEQIDVRMAFRFMNFVLLWNCCDKRFVGPLRHRVPRTSLTLSTHYS